MIFLGDNTYEKAILQRVLQTPNPYNVRIYSLFHAYKHTALCQFWVQRTGERSVSFLAKNGASLILDADPCADMEELSAFIALTGAVSLLCDAALPLQIPGFSARICPVMRLKKMQSLDTLSGCVYTQPRLQDIYALLHQCEGEGFILPAFEGFYLELSHRIRHESALCVGIMRNGRLCACALAVFYCPHGAVIGCVATHPQYRGNGLGKQAVAALTRQLQKAQVERIFLHAAHRNTVAFYEKTGFAVCGSALELHRENGVV